MRELPPTTRCGWGTVPARFAGLALLIAGTASPVAGASGSIVPASIPLTMQSTTTVPALVRIAPAVTGRVVILATADGRLEARPLDAPATTAWTRKFAPTALVAGDGLVYVATADGVTALDADTGVDRWSVALDAGGAPLVWRAGLLLVSSPAGEFTALRTGDGSQAWRAVLGAPLSATPGADANLVMVALSDRRVVALSAADGAPRWTRPLPAVPSALLVDDTRVFVTTDDGSVYSLESKAGATDWRQHLIGGRVTGAPAADARDVFVVTVDGLLAAYNKGSGALEWTKPQKSAARSGALVDGGMVFVPLASGDVEGYLVTAGRPMAVAHLTAPSATETTSRPAAPAAIAGSGDTLRIVLLMDSRDSTTAWSMNVYAKGRLTASPLTTVPGRPLPPLPSAGIRAPQ